MTTITATSVPALADLGDVEVPTEPFDVLADLADDDTSSTVDDAGLPGSHLGYFNDVTTPVWDRITREVDVPTTTLRVVTL